MNIGKVQVPMVFSQPRPVGPHTADGDWLAVVILLWMLVMVGVMMILLGKTFR